MTAQEIYGIVFVIVPGAAIGAATWYWRYSLHHHRRKRSRGEAGLRATVEIGIVVGAIAWLAWRSR
jgi:hypothetical protein